MARFLGVLQGGRGREVTRLGTSKSGLRAQAQGWNVGVTVYAEAELPHPDGGGDCIFVYMTGGSNATTSPRLIGTIRETPDGGPPVWVPEV